MERVFKAMRSDPLITASVSGRVMGPLDHVFRERGPPDDVLMDNVTPAFGQSE